MSSSSPEPGPRRPPSLSDAEDAYEGVVVPISRPGRRGDLLPAQDAERATTRREVDAPARPSPAERRVRRRRQRQSWLHRNALSLAAVSALVAILAVAFALLQMLTRSVPTDQPSPASTTAPGATALAQPGVAVVGAPVTAAAGPSAAATGAREVHSAVRALEPNYTVQRGDSLAAIATRFNTTVQRIQLLNGLPDPRVLSVGQKLVIPPPL